MITPKDIAVFIKCIKEALMRISTGNTVMTVEQYYDNYLSPGNETTPIFSVKAIEEIKEVHLETGAETYRYVTEDTLTNQLIPYTLQGIKSKNPLFDFTKQSSKDVWITLSSAYPTNSITQSELNGNSFLYNQLTINNLSSYSNSGDFTPFAGQNPNNTNVIILAVIFTNIENNRFFDNLGIPINLGGQEGFFIEWFVIPQGTRVIKKENACIQGIFSIGVANNIPAQVASGNGKLIINNAITTGVPTTPINLLFTFDLEQNAKL